MSHSLVRGRFSAPWIAALLVPLLVLAGVLMPGAGAVAAPGPAVTATVTAASAETGLTVQTTGTHFDGITGAYAAIIEKGTEAALTDPSSAGYAIFGYWMPPAVTITGGTFDRPLVAPTDKLDRTKQYEFLIWQGHSAPDATTIYARADIQVSSNQWDAIFPPPAPTPTITASVTGVSAADGATVRVVGTDFGAITGAYAAVIEKGTESGLSMGGDGYAAFGYWMPPGAGFTGGSFDKTLTVPTAELDRGTQYEVLVWQGHSAPDASTIYARTDLVFSGAQWNTLLPPEFGITVTPTTDLADGDTVTVTGTFPATITATGASAGTELVTGVYLMYCDTPTGTVGTAGGRLSGGTVCDTSKQQYLVASAGPAGGTVAGTVTDGIWTFTATITVTERTGTSGIFTRLYHGFRADNTANPYLYDQFVATTFAPPAPVATVVTSVTDASAADGLTVRVVGSNFDGITGAYAAIIEKGTESQVSLSGGYAGFGFWATPGSIVGGAFSKDIVAPTADLDAEKQYEVIVWEAHTVPDEATIYARADVVVAESQWKAIFPSTENPGTEAPATPTPGAGSLSWGIKSSFRTYVTGPIAKGSITTSGISNLLGAFVFPQADAAQLSNGLGTVGYAGSVRFTGHGGTLDLRLSDPQVRIDSPTTATLLVRVNGGSRIAFATLGLSSATRTVAADGSIRYTNAPATLTSSGAVGFDGFYAAGEALDPVSFTIGSAGASLGGTTVVASAAAATTTRTPAPTPPATTGLTVTGDLTAGGEITAEGEDFAPNETGILAVIYSTPTVLADGLVADANGRVSWTGTLPAGLTGTHTLTFQGSVSHGAVLEIAQAAALQCTVADASLTWGVKETFRAYIDGSIANGEWTTEGDVSYETPLFTWAAGTGSADLAEGALDLQFAGSVRFTGHSGALDTTIANPKVVVDGDRAVLLLDVTGTTQEGEVVEATAIEFAELDLAAVEAARDGDTVTWADVPATLTAAGADAFGTYPAGEPLDTVTIVAAIDAACGDAVEAPAEEAPGEVEAEQTASEWPVWATILIAVIVLLILAGIVIAVLRRKRSA